MDDIWTAAAQTVPPDICSMDKQQLGISMIFCLGTAANTQQCKKLTTANKKLTKKLTADPIG